MTGLVVGTPGLNILFEIHNGVNCSTETHACEWPLCVEYTHGDHFINTLEITLAGELDTGTAYPRFPTKWSDPDR